MWDIMGDNYESVLTKTTFNFSSWRTNYLTFPEGHEILEMRTAPIPFHNLRLGKVKVQYFVHCNNIWACISFHYYDSEDEKNTSLYSIYESTPAHHYKFD